MSPKIFLQLHHPFLNPSSISHAAFLSFLLCSISSPFHLVHLFHPSCTSMSPLAYTPPPPKLPSPSRPSSSVSLNLSFPFYHLSTVSRISVAPLSSPIPPLLPLLHLIFLSSLLLNLSSSSLSYSPICSLSLSLSSPSIPPFPVSGVLAESCAASNFPPDCL